MRIETFGGLTLYRDGVAVTRSRNRSGRVQALLEALVVLGGERVSQERLIDILWPEVDADIGANRLKVTLSRLRNLGVSDQDEPAPWIFVREGRVGIDPALCSVDSLAFEHALARTIADPKAIDELRAALEGHHGVFLDGSDSGWIDAHRERLERRFTDGAAALAARCLAAGRPEAALPLLTEAHERWPASERVAVELMRLLTAGGLSGEALDVFRQTREALRRDYGVEPGQALRAVVERVRPN